MTQRTLSIPREHPAFAGHFPGNPVVPGVVLLDEALAALAADGAIPREGYTVLASKFLSPVRPGEPLALDYEREANGRVRLSIRTSDREVASALVAAGVPATEARPPAAPAPAPAPPAAPEPVRPAAGSAEWARGEERGSQALLRFYTWLSLRCGRTATRAILHAIAIYFLLFAPSARRHSRGYLARALGRPPSVADLYRHILCFASTIHDRIFLLNGRADVFAIDTVGEPLVAAARDRREGAFLMGAHLGSFEVIRAIGHRQESLDVTMAMYAGTASRINGILHAINPELKADIIEFGHISVMLDIRARLERGSFVGMLADRSPGDEESERVRFLGEIAQFPIGPMRCAAMLRRRVYFMAGFYLGGNRYRVVFEEIADFTNVASGARSQAVRTAVHAFAATIERHCHEYPYNWFNFFDFWKPRRGALPDPAGDA